MTKDRGWTRGEGAAQASVGEKLSRSGQFLWSIPTSGHRVFQLIAGLAHFARAWPIPLPPDGTIVHRIERNHPDSVHVILPHIGFGDETSALEPYLADWPIPSLVSLHATWLAELDAALVQQGYFGNPDPDGREHPRFTQGITLGTIADSYLYLGQRSSVTNSTPNPALYRGLVGSPSFRSRRQSTRCARRRRASGMATIGAPFRRYSNLEHWRSPYRQCITYRANIGER
jgi:hypothetical protein